MGLPLEGIKVIEFAGLAPGPFAGMILADFGATVTRIDRLGSSFSSDLLCRHKRSISVSLKQPAGVDLVRRLISQADVVIDPFRPGVMERLGLGPEECLRSNEKLVFARLTGFRRVGEYSKMAGHDINYAALSGVLAMLGPASGNPLPPVNLLADFAGGGLLCALGIVLALFERSNSGRGQAVESDMVTGARYVASFLLLAKRPSHGLPIFTESRGNNILDGGAPWYDTYKTSDGKYMSLGAIEPQFYSEFLTIFHKQLAAADHPVSSIRNQENFPQPSQQMDRSTWPALRNFLTQAFASQTRQKWSDAFIGTDACCVPVLEPAEVGTLGQGHGEREWQEVKNVEGAAGGWPSPAPRLSRTPARQADEKTYGSMGEDEKILLIPGTDTLLILKEAGISEAEVKLLVEGELWRWQTMALMINGRHWHELKSSGFRSI